MSEGVDVFFIVYEALDDFACFWVGVGFVASAIDIVVEGAVEISHDNSMWGSARVRYGLDFFPKVVGVVFGGCVNCEDVYLGKIGEGEEEMEGVIVVVICYVGNFAAAGLA